jgi:hypothetical protein
MDGYADLLQTAINLANGSRSSFTHLVGEPVGHRIFFSGATDMVYIQIVRFDDMYAGENPWSGGSLRWAARTNLTRFLSAALTMATDTRTTHGDAKYEKVWGFPYPAGLHNDLEQLVGQR